MWTHPPQQLNDPLITPDPGVNRNWGSKRPFERQLFDSMYVTRQQQGRLLNSLWSKISKSVKLFFAIISLSDIEFFYEGSV